MIDLAFESLRRKEEEIQREEKLRLLKRELELKITVLKSDLNLLTKLLDMVLESFPNISPEVVELIKGLVSRLEPYFSVYNAHGLYMLVERCAREAYQLLHM